MHQIIKPYCLQNPQFSKAMFARLKPHSIIDSHTDAALGNLYSHKIHVPIITDETIMFSVEETSCHLMEGYAYEVNNIAAHSAANPTDLHRVHFIFEVFDEPR